jgi:hypothetical protein
MNMIRHDNVTSDKPRRLRCPSRAQQLMGCVVRQNLFALFCADRQEHNDLRLMGQDGACPSNFWRDDLSVVQILGTRQSASLHCCSGSSLLPIY